MARDRLTLVIPADVHQRAKIALRTAKARGGPSSLQALMEVWVQRYLGGTLRVPRGRTGVVPSRKQGRSITVRLDGPTKKAFRKQLIDDDLTVGAFFTALFTRFARRGPSALDQVALDDPVNRGLRASTSCGRAATRSSRTR